MIAVISLPEASLFPFLLWKINENVFRTYN